jgi:hypothetical protein
MPAMTDRPDPDIETLREARATLIPSLIAVKGWLDRPYPDDARWTPWTRFIERALARFDEEYVAALASVERRLREAERERDEAREDSRLLVGKNEDMRRDRETMLQRSADWRVRAEAAEAEVVRLREELRNASDYCARPAGVCFDPALASGQPANSQEGPTS